MYVPEHLKWRILIARALDVFHYDRHIARRSHSRLFRFFGKYLLGVTYDTYLNYLHSGHDLRDMRLPAYIYAAIGLLEALRIACERLGCRHRSREWTVLEIAKEACRVLHERTGCTPRQKIRID